jgi:glutaredoxin 3
MSNVKVEMYATQWCPYCARARTLLNEKGVAFTEIDIESAPGLKDQMIERAQRKTVPQIFINNAHIGGCDDLYALDQSGGLDPLLAG